jgi:hypothetical protein
VITYPPELSRCRAEYHEAKGDAGMSTFCRRRFLAEVGCLLLGTTLPGIAKEVRTMAGTTAMPRPVSGEITLFLCGDVMTGRCIDQILPHQVPPILFEDYMRSALGYVDLAERSVGPIPRSVNYAYIWWDALAELARVRPNLRIVNLETAITTSDASHPGVNFLADLSQSSAEAISRQVAARNGSGT